jgi:hypothetical protein
MALLHLNHAARHAKAATAALKYGRDTEALAHLKDGHSDLHWAMKYAHRLAAEEAAL